MLLIFVKHCFLSGAFDKTSMPLDNKELRKQLNERLQALDDALWIKESLLDAMRTEKFTVTDYLKRKAKVMLSLEGETASSGSSTKAPKEKKNGKNALAAIQER